jgi:hypothetical protein
MSRKLWIPAAEKARHLGVCTSTIAKAIQKLELKEKSISFQQRYIKGIKILLTGRSVRHK